MGQYVLYGVKLVPVGHDPLLCEKCNEPVDDPANDSWCEPCWEKILQEETKKQPLQPNRAVGTYVRSGGRV